MDLFKTFTRGQENAQDQLNANFEAIEGAVIVDSGSNANGRWVKWADGTMECYMTRSVGIHIGVGTRDDPYRTYVTDVDFPEVFVEKPVIACSAEHEQGILSTSAAYFVSYQKVTIAGLKKVQATSIFPEKGAESLTIHMIAKGIWK